MAQGQGKQRPLQLPDSLLHRSWCEQRREQLSAPPPPPHTLSHPGPRAGMVDLQSQQLWAHGKATAGWGRGHRVRTRRLLFSLSLGALSWFFSPIQIALRGHCTPLGINGQRESEISCSLGPTYLSLLIIHSPISTPSPT